MSSLQANHPPRNLSRLSTHTSPRRPHLRSFQSHESRFFKHKIHANFHSRISVLPIPLSVVLASFPIQSPPVIIKGGVVQPICSGLEFLVALAMPDGPGRSRGEPPEPWIPGYLLSELITQFNSSCPVSGDPCFFSQHFIAVFVTVDVCR